MTTKQLQDRVASFAPHSTCDGSGVQRSFTLIERLKLIKEGRSMLVSNAEADRAFSQFYRRLPETTKNWHRTEGTGLSTRTLFVKTHEGEPFGDKVVWSDHYAKITLVVNTEFRSAKGMAIAIDLTKDNFVLSEVRGENGFESAVIQLASPSDARIFLLPELMHGAGGPAFFGYADDSTLGVPSSQVEKSGDSEGRFLVMPAGPVVSLLHRFSDRNHEGMHSGLVIHAGESPSSSAGMLVDGSMGVPFQVKGPAAKAAIVPASGQKEPPVRATSAPVNGHAEVVG